MVAFNGKLFWYIFGIAASIFFAIVLTIIVRQGIFTVANVLLAILSSLSASALMAAVIAVYRIPLAGFGWAYRLIMRSLARRAFRSSLSHAMTPIECLGILERRGGVALRIGIGSAEYSEFDQILHVYDAANKELWGRINLVEIQSSTCIYEPIDRVNPRFWEHLEDIMRHNTSPPPGIYIVRELPDSILAVVERLLNNWR